MAYNYFPATYQPVIPQVQTVPQVPNVPTPAPSNNGNGLIWVQGEAAAKSYLVAPNTTVMLMDSEGDRFYLKSADGSGMPLPIRTFVYKELKENETPVQAPSFTRKDFDEAASEYVKKSEFEKLKSEIETLMKSKKKKDDE